MKTLDSPGNLPDDLCADAQERSPRERPILFSGPMVRALLDGTKTQTRRALTMNNSTVLGDRWGRNSPWGGLDFANAVPRTQSTIMRYIAGSDAPRDVHLDVPFVHPEDAARGMESDGCVYRVRPQWEVGDLLWVRETCRAEELSQPPRSRPATRKEREQLGRTSVIALDELDGMDGVRYLADDAWERIENTPTAGEAWSALYYYRGRGKAGVGNQVPSIHMPRWASRITLQITDVRAERLNEISEADALAEGTQEPSLVPMIGACWSERDAYAKLWEHINGAGSWGANPWVWAVSFRPVAARLGVAAQVEVTDPGRAQNQNPNAGGKRR